MNQIAPHLLWVGHAGDGRNFRQILDLGIQAIVQLAMEEPPLQPPREIIYCRFPLVDGGGNRPELLGLTLRTVVNLLETRTPTLLCCGAGMSRAPAIAAAALSLFLGQSPDHCLELVVGRHPRDVARGLWAEVKQARLFELIKKRFTDRSRLVMHLASEEATACQRKHLCTTDILIALVKEKGGVAHHVIVNMGLDLIRLTQEVHKVSEQLPSEDQINQSEGIRLTRQVIDCALDEAQKLGHNYVGTEHLLLGITRAPEGMAAQVLVNLGVNLEDVGNEVLNILGHQSRR